MTERERHFAEEIGVPTVELQGIEIDPELIESVPGRIVKHHQVLPLKRVNETIWLAMYNPRDVRAMDDVRMATGCKVIPVLAGWDDLNEAIPRFYAVLAAGTPTDGDAPDKRE